MNSATASKKAFVAYILLCQTSFVLSAAALSPDLASAEPTVEQEQKNDPVQDNIFADGKSAEKQTQSKSQTRSETGSVKDLPFKYSGNLYSHKFHRPRCPFCKAMSEYKKVRFHFRYQAIEQGFSPCRYCLPPVWTTVQAKIKIPAKIDSAAPNEGDPPLSVQSGATEAALDISRP